MSYDEQPDGDPHGECAAEIERLNEEVLEQCRLNGMGAEREARLMAQLAESQARERRIIKLNQMLREPDWHIESIRDMQRELTALEQGLDHTALDALLRAEREKERERFVNIVKSCCGDTVIEDGLIDEIQSSALGDE